VQENTFIKDEQYTHSHVWALANSNRQKKVSVDEIKDEETTRTMREQAWMGYNLLLLTMMMILITCTNSHLKP
jgi:hypothetical protein